MDLDDSTENPELPSGSPSTRNDDSASTWSPAPDRPEILSTEPAAGSNKPASASNVTDLAGKALSRRAAAVEANTRSDPVGGEVWSNPLCSRIYLVLGRLFKLHPDFDAAIEGILAGDTNGCVVLIHETRDEEWTRVVWTRLRDVLVPKGMCVFRFNRFYGR